jgi:toxin HigB-1
MNVTFADADLERLETDPDFLGSFGQDVVRAYRRCMQLIRSAVDERDLYAFKSRRFELLKSRPGQHSLRLNDQWRLIVEIVKGNPKNTLRIIEIEDYH